MNNVEKVYFAGGCFWGVEYYFNGLEGVVSTKVGYMGGYKSNPTYEEVCSGESGHTEVVEVKYDSSIVDFEEIAKLFFEIHDPTQLNRQGPDVGLQYRSAIFYTEEEQKATAIKLIDMLKDKGIKVVTDVIRASTFWEAEDYHQRYYAKKGQIPYCHIKTKRF